MSRSFSDNVSNFLSLDSLSFAANQDWSIACYIKPAIGSLDMLRVPFSIADTASSGAPRIAIATISTPSAQGRNQLGIQILVDGPTPGTGSYVLLVATFDDANNETKIYMDSATPTTDTTAYGGFGTMDRIMVGAFGDLTISAPADGLIAQVIAWEGLELSTTNVQALLDATTTADYGAVQSGSVAFHYPLDESNLADETATLSDLAITGSVPSDSDDPFAAAAGNFFPASHDTQYVRF